VSRRIVRFQGFVIEKVTNYQISVLKEKDPKSQISSTKSQINPDPAKPEMNIEE
jgi:hypothetical protein